jgi:electron transport complex protein RnfC
MIVPFVIKKNSDMKKQLALSSSGIEIIDAPEPTEVMIPVPGIDAKDSKINRKIGSRVVTGEEILPGIFSTVTGRIMGIEKVTRIKGDCSAFRIEVAEKEETDNAIKADPEFLKSDPGDVWLALNRANLNFRQIPEDLQTMVISAVETDPLVSIYQQILKNDKDLVFEGLKLIRFLTSARKVIFTLPRQLNQPDYKIPADLADVFWIEPVYPNGVPEVLLGRISREHNLGRCGFLPVEKLVGAVRAIKEGKPFVHKVISVIGKKENRNFRIRIGTPVKELVKNMEIGEHDKLVVGGPLRGYASFYNEFPVDDQTDLIFIQDAGDVVLMENKPCINCGKCVRACPVQLEVNLICRYSEFSLFEKCRELDIFDCFECGLCAYHCPSLRSLVQLIRLAKSELQKKEGVESE